MVHENTASEYTRGEIIAIVAPVMGEPIEDIDNVIILTIGKCDHCEHRDGLGLVETISDPNDLLLVLELAISHVLEGHMS